MVGMPCQDRAAGFRMDPLAGVVLCDGAGSCLHSELAADSLTKWLPAFLQKNFDRLYVLSEREAAKDLALSGQRFFLDSGFSPDQSMCTLLFYTVHQDGRWLCGHIGDGYIFSVRQHAATVLSFPENGFTPSETYFLSLPNAADHLRIYRGINHEDCAVLLTSDGGSDLLFDSMHHAPALAVNQLCQWLQDSANDEETVSNALEKTVEDKMIPETHDDISIAILSCTDITFKTNVLNKDGLPL